MKVCNSYTSNVAIRRTKINLLTFFFFYVRRRCFRKAIENAHTPRHVTGPCSAANKNVFICFADAPPDTNETGRQREPER